jgi:predicted hotdog family 3-hydroxylacyl-ACP dehydratase
MNNQVNFPIIDKDFVEQLIPQKFPFVMIDKLLSFTETEITAGLTVPVENIFVENAVFQESGLIEHMAQSVALHTGYQFYLKKEPAPTGYIGSIKSIEIVRLPILGEAIETTVNIIQEFMGVTLVEISSKINNKEIARGQMKTVIAN